MDINYIAILIASVLQFIVGAIWYTPVFGKTWARIHGVDSYSKEDRDRMMKGMGPLFAVQFFVTVITTFVLALFKDALPSAWNVWGEAAFFWLGFVVPTQVSAVIFGGTPSKWILPKIGIMAGGSFVCLMVAATVLHYF